jgi:hypothetical protein
MIASLRFFDPKLTEGALLELSSFDELLEGLFIFVRVSARLIFFAALTLVIGDSAREAITLGALNASEIIGIDPSIVDEGIVAVCSGTPRNVLLHSYCLKERILLELLHIFRTQNSVHISRGNLNLASLEWANNRAFRLRNFSLKVSLNALFMKDVFTVCKYA